MPRLPDFRKRKDFQKKETDCELRKKFLHHSGQQQQVKRVLLNLPRQVYLDARGAVVCGGGEGDVEVLGVVQGSHLDRVFQDDVLGLAVVAKVGLGQDLEKQE